MTGRDPLRARRAQRADGEAVARLFEAAGCACHCQYWQYPGDHRSWQVTCAQSPEENRRQLTADLGAERLVALVVEEEGAVLGWLRVEREAEMAKLYQGRLYRGLPCFADRDRSRGSAVACLLVDPAQRRRGVARALVAGAVELCRSRGDTFLEAFPRGQTDVTDEEQWLGPLEIYRDLGFETVHQFAPYPVLRLTLGARAADSRL